jgi:hypothetical protein
VHVWLPVYPFPGIVTAVNDHPKIRGEHYAIRSLHTGIITHHRVRKLIPYAEYVDEGIDLLEASLPA